MQIDLDGTDFGAVAAKGRSVTEVLPFVHLLEMWCDHTADRSAVGRAIGVASDILVDRAGIEACTTTNTVETFPGYRIGQYVGASVIKQDHIHLFRTVCFSWLTGTTDDGIVHGHFLTGSVSRQQRPEKGQVVNGWNDLFDADDHDMYLRPGTTQTGVALIFGDGYAARIGKDEIGAGHPDLRSRVFCSEINPGHLCQFFRRQVGRRIEFLCKKSGHILLALMHGGCYNMIWCLPIQLLDVFSQIRLHTFNADPLEIIIQMDLLCDHALTLDDRLAVMFPADLTDGSLRILRIFCPDDLTAALLEIPLELLQMYIQRLDRLPLRHFRLSAHEFHIDELLFANGHHRIILADVESDLTTMLEVGRLDRTLGHECLGCLSHICVFGGLT